MERFYFSDTIRNFCLSDPSQILGKLAEASGFDDKLTQKFAWQEQINILRPGLDGLDGSIFFEFDIPRMGRRIDVVLLIRSVVFVIEFKAGATSFGKAALEQVWDYALDLKNFHEASHKATVVPILIATEARSAQSPKIGTARPDGVYDPIVTNPEALRIAIDRVLDMAHGPDLLSEVWRQGRYRPTPTILEAALALYNGHSVAEISKSDASATNLTQTASAISEIIEASKRDNRKSICLVTGVPGAGKTLVGLNVATTHQDAETGLHSTFLSGNQPLVTVLQEALAKDQAQRAKESGDRLTLSNARSRVKAFIQNVHHFRDNGLIEPGPPSDHVVLFDEAQRAWNRDQTRSFMKRKKGQPNFQMSEPEFLISCMDRHSDWAVIVGLIGGGQEINTGEAGIGEWLDALDRSFPTWRIHVSDRLTDTEYGVADRVRSLPPDRVSIHPDLHLAVSMRSFRAENVSLFVKQLLDIDQVGAEQTFRTLRSNYPIVLTRDLSRAKQWLREKARGTERYGIVVSSQAERLRPQAIHVKAPMDPKHWFLADSDDIRSSYFLEDVATEFHVQGLELDWSCVVWDADFRRAGAGWDHWRFKGSKWQRINKLESQKYQKNAYRVLMTRARQGMVIVVPEGDDADLTRNRKFYDATFDYLASVGLDSI